VRGRGGGGLVRKVTFNKSENKRKSAEGRGGGMVEGANTIF